jgi:hypothetical protein
MVNRAALLLRYKEPAVRWINETDPNPGDRTISLESANEERTVYLISDRVAESGDSVERWVRKNFVALFENELAGWYTDSDLWPSRRTFKLFNEWFAVECHTVLVDLVGGDIYDDET